MSSQTGQIVALQDLTDRLVVITNNDGTRLNDLNSTLRRKERELTRLKSELESLTVSGQSLQQELTRGSIDRKGLSRKMTVSCLNI